MNKMVLAFMVSVERPGDLEGSSSYHSGDKWNEANDYVAKELPKIRREIESAIRAELEEEPNS